MISREGILKKSQEISSFLGTDKVMEENAEDEDELYAKIEASLTDYLTEKRELFTEFVMNDENEILSYDEDSAHMIKKIQEDLSLVDSTSIYIFK